jgi:two-component system sensor histidine kinase DesK
MMTKELFIFMKVLLDLPVDFRSRSSLRSGKPFQVLSQQGLPLTCYSRWTWNMRPRINIPRRKSEYIFEDLASSAPINKVPKSTIGFNLPLRKAKEVLSMFKKFFNTLKSSGISPYIWSVFSILPFYFIFRSTSKIEIAVGVILTILFFISLRFAFISRQWPVYLWTGILISISITMTILFQFVYFAFYIAYYNGHITNRIAFLTLYVIHLVATTISINFNFVTQEPLFLEQLPFIIIIWISVILLPFNIYNRKKQEKLEEQLEDANKRIADLVKQEERQRIARDLHDTLGQKLSLIGLKSDLARKLISKDPEQAKEELIDVQQTARTALNEVRKMVSQMRGIRLKDEIILVKQILKAAAIDFIGEEDIKLNNVSLFLENILSLCMKEAVTNVVKHSKATECRISIEQTWNEVRITVQDNGIGMDPAEDIGKGSGLLGLGERLDFVNGSIDIISNNGTTIVMKVPTVVKQTDKEERP